MGEVNHVGGDVVVQDLTLAHDGVAQELVVLAAAWLGKTRLIDNVELRRS